MKSTLKYLKTSKLVWYIVSTLILAGLIYFSDFNEFIAAVGSVDLFYLCLSALIGLFVYIIWAIIWHSFFTKMGIETTKIKSLHMLLAGNFLNSVTPLGQLGGEPFMAYIISENTGASYERSLSSVVSADLINSIPVILYSCISLFYLLVNEKINGDLYNIYTTFGVFVFTVFIIVYLLWFDKDLIESSCLKILNYIDKNSGIGESLVDKLRKKIANISHSFNEIGSDRHHLLKLVVISLLWPLSHFICLYLIAEGLGIDLSYVTICLTPILSGLALFSPTPGGSGTFEATFAGLLTIFSNISLDIAVATAVLFRLSTFWPAIPLGYYSILKLKQGN